MSFQVPFPAWSKFHFTYFIPLGPAIMQFLQKRLKLNILSREDAQDSEFCSFFGRIEDTINCFRDLLTFSCGWFICQLFSSFYRKTYDAGKFKPKISSRFHFDRMTDVWIAPILCVCNNKSQGLYIYNRLFLFSGAVNKA